MKNIIKNINNNKIKLIGLLTILILFWIILYFIPEIFISLFNTLLGNFILLLSTILVVSYNVKYGLIMGIIFIVIFRFIQLLKIKENFEWNKETENDFLITQNTLNRDIIFDINTIKNQASQEQVEYFNKNGKWYWSQNTQKLYKEAIDKNKFIRNYNEDSMNYAMTIYNETAILRILSYQTKEGQMLLNGILVNDSSSKKLEELPNGLGAFGYNSGLTKDKTKDIIKCNMEKENGAFLERIQFTGKDGIYGAQTEKISPIDYNELESIIPGFKFFNKPCNPCGAINASPDYSCPFEIKLNNETQSPFISSIWQNLWNIQI